MTRRLILGFSLALACLAAWPAVAQIGTPGTGPLVPGGPRQGLGPPSLSDSVPDIRLHAPGGGIPGAGPPIDPGSSWRGSPSNRPGAQRLVAEPVGRHCRTPQRVCLIVALSPVGTGCSCRSPGGGRVRGHVVR